MKEPVLIIIKPDGLSKGLTGEILSRFSAAKLELIAIKIANATRDIAEAHYRHIKDRPFFKDVIDYLMGKHHAQKKLLAIIYYGENATSVCRKIAGDTNPEKAGYYTIRGCFGRITTSGIFENVVHVSSSKKESEREIKLWFHPQEITRRLYKTKKTIIKTHSREVWK